MSPIAIPSSVTAALPAINVHPHGHGHKKGAELDLSTDSTDSTSSTAAQVPVATAQNLFGKAFSALQQLIGLTPPAASTPAAAPNIHAAAASATVNPKINLMA
jgi:formiminotetrahydrofolate cyclodeaminase